MKTGDAILREKKRRPAARPASDRGTEERGRLRLFIIVDFNIIVLDSLASFLLW